MENRERIATYKVTLPVEITFKGSSIHDADTITAVAEIMLKEKIKHGEFKIDSEDICIVKAVEYSKEELEEEDRRWKEFLGVKK